jgi:hypothetical protein
MSTMLSRSGRSNPDGKLTQRFDIPVSDELNEAVIALATIAGVSKAEWLRDLIERSVFGELPMARRLARVRGSREWDESPMEGRT